jgi:hypothetical protein
MGTIEVKKAADSVAITCPATSTEAPVANYDAVRFNAMKHGILSRLVVLAHEDGAEFADLQAALIDEHRPAGVTERHLIEELATIIWRKRRVLMAENAQINEGLKVMVNRPESIMPASAPFQCDMSGESTDLRDLMVMTPEEHAENLKSVELDLASERKAASILRKNGVHAYTKARRALIPESRGWWDECVADEEYPATAEGLAEFIEEFLEPTCRRLVKESQFTQAIKAQTLGRGLQTHRLETLNRYETHLDRKFERTLAMLLKLKLLRNG